METEKKCYMEKAEESLRKIFSDRNDISVWYLNSGVSINGGVIKVIFDTPECPSIEVLETFLSEGIVKIIRNPPAKNIESLTASIPFKCGIDPIAMLEKIALEVKETLV